MDKCVQYCSDSLEIAKICERNQAVLPLYEQTVAIDEGSIKECGYNLTSRNCLAVPEAQCKQWQGKKPYPVLNVLGPGYLTDDLPRYQPSQVLWTAEDTLLVLLPAQEAMLVNGYRVTDLLGGHTSPLELSSPSDPPGTIFNKLVKVKLFRLAFNLFYYGQGEETFWVVLF